METASPRPNYDAWLDRWPEFRDGTGRTALDVGCGPGFDTQVLRSRGFSVVASDISADAFSASRLRNPGVEHVVADARTLAPFHDGGFDVVVACLSLHYFDRLDSSLAIRSLHRVLREGGVFAFRVNAWDDANFGAPTPFLPWEVTLYEGRPKQFFTEDMLRELLMGRFEILSLEKQNSTRYGKKKSLFECISKRRR